MAKMSKISNQRDNYFQTHRHLDPDLNFVVGLASLLAEAQTSITKHPKLWYWWEHVWETLLLRIYNSTVVIASLSTATAANLNEAQWCHSPFLPSLYSSFCPHFEIYFHIMATESPQSWNACCHLDYAREANFYWKHSFPFLLIFAAPTLLLAALDPYQKKSM